MASKVPGLNMNYVNRAVNACTESGIEQLAFFTIEASTGNNKTTVFWRQRPYVEDSDPMTPGEMVDRCRALEKAGYLLHCITYDRAKKGAERLTVSATAPKDVILITDSAAKSEKSEKTEKSGNPAESAPVVLGATTTAGAPAFVFGTCNTAGMQQFCPGCVNRVGMVSYCPECVKRAVH